jgi:hypothetical protein
LSFRAAILLSFAPSASLTNAGKRSQALNNLAAYAGAARICLALHIEGCNGGAMESAITVKGVRANWSRTLTFDQKALRLPGFERP